MFNNVGYEVEMIDSIERLPERMISYLSEPDDNGCLLWTGTQSVSGYGFLAVHQRNVKAHRLAFYYANGYFPGEGRVVGHKCDVKLCCNPDHLEDITHKENMKQMKDRNRAFKGKKQRLTREEKIYISTSKESIRVLTDKFKCHPRTIERIRADFI